MDNCGRVRGMVDSQRSKVAGAYFRKCVVLVQSNETIPKLVSQLQKEVWLVVDVE